MKDDTLQKLGTVRANDQAEATTRRLRAALEAARNAGEFYGGDHVISAIDAAIESVFTPPPAQEDL